MFGKGGPTDQARVPHQFRNDVLRNPGAGKCTASQVKSGPTKMFVFYSVVMLHTSE